MLDPRVARKVRLLALDVDGARHFATTTDAAAIGELLVTDACGRPVALAGGVGALAG